jgi:hypothetical protein
MEKARRYRVTLNGVTIDNMAYSAEDALYRACPQKYGKLGRIAQEVPGYSLVEAKKGHFDDGTTFLVVPVRKF